MEELQKKIDDVSKRLANYTNYVLEVISIIISIAIVYLLLYLGQFGFKWYTQLIAIVLVLAYFITRRLIFLKNNNKQLETVTKNLKIKHRKMQLYMPLFDIGYKGFTIRNAMLFIENDMMYLEAFDRKKKDEKHPKSITIEAGKEFYIYDAEKVLDRPFINYKAKLMLEEYNFFLPEIREVIEIIKKYNVEIKKEG